MKNLNRKFKNTLEIKSLEEMDGFALDFLKKLSQKPENGAVVLCLSGDLGSGKTTFTQDVAMIFGAKEHVTSPTFILQKKYNVPSGNDSAIQNLKQISQIIHMDMYRIENIAELQMLGFSELLKDPKNLLIIEWPERVIEEIPTGSKWISFTFVDETTRRVQW